MREVHAERPAVRCGRVVRAGAEARHVVVLVPLLPFGFAT